LIACNLIFKNQLLYQQKYCNQITDTFWKKNILITLKFKGNYFIRTRPYQQAHESFSNRTQKHYLPPPATVERQKHFRTLLNTPPVLRALCHFQYDNFGLVVMALPVKNILHHLCGLCPDSSLLSLLFFVQSQIILRAD
jgi:hypothetical protein